MAILLLAASELREKRPNRILELSLRVDKIILVFYVPDIVLQIGHYFSLKSTLPVYTFCHFYFFDELGRSQETLKQRIHVAYILFLVG